MNEGIKLDRGYYRVYEFLHSLLAASEFWTVGWRVRGCGFTVQCRVTAWWIQSSASNFRSLQFTSTSPQNRNLNHWLMDNADCYCLKPKPCSPMPNPLSSLQLCSLALGNQNPKLAFLAGNAKMEKEIKTTIRGYIGTTIRIHPVIPS